MRYRKYTERDTEKENENKIITRIENTASVPRASTASRTNHPHTPWEMRRTKARCARGRGKGEGVIVAGIYIVAPFVTTIPGLVEKERARRLPIGQIQTVPGNFLLTVRRRRNSASARARVMISYVDPLLLPPRASACLCAVAFAPELLSYLITSLRYAPAIFGDTRFLAFRSVYELSRVTLCLLLQESPDMEKTIKKKSKHLL